MPEDFIRMMHALFAPREEKCAETSWRPPADVYRTERGWLVKFDLAGVLPKDLQLEVRGGRLTLRGCRRDWLAEYGHRHYSMEISYSHFERSIDLPFMLEPAQIASEYRDGMLLVRIQTEK